MGRFKKVDGVPTIAMPRVPLVTVERGATATGKTQALLDAVRALVSQGSDPASILVLCATPDAARAFEGRLGMPGVRIQTARDCALGLLGAPEACSLFGHGPRVLLPYEEDILFEDVKVSGLEVDRLEGMLSFFKRSMTEISDDHPDFLIDDDERAVMDTLRRGLDLRAAYLEQQISANAARFLTTEAGQTVRYEHVFADDYQLLCRASQVMAGLLATSSLHVAVDPDATDRVYEPYPNAKGIGELLQANPHAQVVELDTFRGSQAVRHAVNALHVEAGLPVCGCSDVDKAAPGAVSIETLRNPDEEVAHAADLIVNAIGDGMAPQDIYAVCSVDDWAGCLADALDAHDVRSVVAYDWSGLLQSGADTSDDAAYLRMLTALLLAGDASDECAWRDWCAFGDPLAASGAVDAIARFAQPRDMGMHEALAWLAGGGQAGTAALDRSDVASALGLYRQAEGLLAHVDGLEGEGLLRALADEICGQGEPIPEQLTQLCADAPAAADARALREFVLSRASNPGWKPAACGLGEGAVRIGPMERLCGLAPRLIVFPGFINGFYPGHGFFDETITPPGKVAAAHAADARRLAVTAAKAHDTLAFTAFTTMPAADAERLQAKIDRIALERRVRIARVSPSIFCAVVESRPGE